MIQFITFISFLGLVLGLAILIFNVTLLAFFNISFTHLVKISYNKVINFIKIIPFLYSYVLKTFIITYGILIFIRISSIISIKLSTVGLNSYHFFTLVKLCLYNFLIIYIYIFNVLRAL